MTNADLGFLAGEAKLPYVIAMLDVCLDLILGVQARVCSAPYCTAPVVTLLSSCASPYTGSQASLLISMKSGKPEQPLLDILSDELGLNPDKTVFIGDSLEVR